MICKKYIRFVLLASLFFVAFSCSKKEIATEQQTVSFPDGEEDGAIRVETIFDQTYLDAQFNVYDDNEEFQNVYSKLKSISNAQSEFSVYVYNSLLPAGSESLVPKGNISVFIRPDINSINLLSDDFDLSNYEGYDLVAVSDKGDICLVKDFFDDDLLGSFNGLVRWINGYCEKCKKIENYTSDSNELPEATELFNAFQMHETINFNYKDKTVASVACSKVDKESGHGSVEVYYTITPLHAFDDQPGCGDYYYVHCTTLLNSKGMYKGRYTKKHGGVYARICAFYARKFGIESYMSNKSGQVVGTFVAGGQPSPSTTIGSTTYSSSVDWNFGSGLTGGYNGGALFTVSVNGGVKCTHSESRTVSDLDVALDQSNAIVKYVFDFTNAPKYEPIYITAPSLISTSTATLPFSYIVYIPEVKDNSTDDYFINFKINQLDYNSCKFYSTGADFDTYTWGMKDTEEKETVIGRLISRSLRPNRIPTGKLKIIHNDGKFGSYIFSVTATDVNSKKEYSYSKSRYTIGQTFSQILPTGEYSVTMKVGNSAESTTTVVTSQNIKIDRAGESQLLTGANFEEKK